MSVWAGGTPREGYGVCWAPCLVSDEVTLVNKSKVIGFEEEEEKSSHYGLYMLGLTCATRVKTEKSDSVS